MSDDKHSEKEKHGTSELASEQQTHSSQQENASNADEPPSNTLSISERLKRWRTMWKRYAFDRKIELALTFVGGIIAALGLVIAFLLWWTAYGQFGVMREQAAKMQGQLDAMKTQSMIMRQTLEVQQRAYVHVQSVKVVRFVIGRPVEAVVSYKNTGLTPANRLFVIPHSFIYEWQRTQGFPPPVDKTNVACEPLTNMGQILPPGVTREVNTLRLFGGSKVEGKGDVVIEREGSLLKFKFKILEPLTADRIIEIMSRKRQWYVVVYVSYYDAFGKCHASAEPFQYDILHREFVPGAFNAIQMDEETTQSQSGSQPVK